MVVKSDVVLHTKLISLYTYEERNTNKKIRLRVRVCLWGMAGGG